MKEQLMKEFEQLLDNATKEDIAVIKSWMDGLERKQSGEISTYLSAGLHMERILETDSCQVSIPITTAIHNHGSIPDSFYGGDSNGNSGKSLATVRRSGGYNESFH